MGTTTDVCVVVPVLNEAGVLADVLVALREQFHHVVVVDDGSTDGSAEIATAVGATVLRHALTLGQGAALRTGFEYVLRRTSAAWVVTFDADGQHDSRDAAVMLQTARERGLDVVFGTRALGPVEGQPRARRWLLRLALAHTRATTGLALTDTHNGLRVLSRRAVATLTIRQRGMAHASEIVALVAASGLSWAEVPVHITYSAYSRAKGQSNLNAFNVLYDLVLARLRAPS